MSISLVQLEMSRPTQTSPANDVKLKEVKPLGIHQLGAASFSSEGRVPTHVRELIVTFHSWLHSSSTLKIDLYAGRFPCAALLSALAAPGTLRPFAARAK